ncbi:phage terminase large subunit [Candidatus Saccharibacteria bacterium]|nr:phage terminase large subunit [Candidatus Saccharibacteria bacterium]
MRKRIRIVQGGSSSAKTFSILLDELNYSLTHPNKITTIVTDSYPNLRVGAIRDFLRICKFTNASEFGIWNKTDHTFTLPNGSILEFYSVDTMGALGSRRDRLFVNEANRISYETFTQLEIRTKEQITLDFNPISEFYAHTELMKRPDADFIKLTYKDNEALDKNIVDALEARIGDGTSNWARVYIFGEVGSLEGNVYEGWNTIDEIPEGFVLKRYGVDFGWNDPTAITAIYENDKREICLDEVLYQSKLPTPQLIELCKELQPELFVCDSARPEIIAEMQANGIRAIGCDKSPVGKQNSIIYGIDLVKRRKIYYTRKSRDLEKEYLTYAWRKKKSTGETIDEPEDTNNHLMDSVRYGLMDLERKPVEYGGVR